MLCVCMLAATNEPNRKCTYLMTTNACLLALSQIHKNQTCLSAHAYNTLTLCGRNLSLETAKRLVLLFVSIIVYWLSRSCLHANTSAMSLCIIVHIW